ncbi:Cys1 [Hyposoter didymator ichnovirus]|nr:Cys1 [Hyposoter didymator ichnovirus]
MVHNPNNSGIYTMALLVMLALGLITVAAVMGTATVRAMAASHGDRLEPEVTPACIPNYADCTDLRGTKPCCRQQELRVGQTVPEDFICFRFGVGQCQPLSSVEKLETYAQLVKSANETNLFKLLGQYYKHKILEKNTTEHKDLKL